MERRQQGPPEVTTPWSNTSPPSSHVSEPTSIIDIFLGRVNNNPRRANTDGQASKGKKTIPGFLASWGAGGEPELKAVLRGGESEARRLKTSSRQEPVLCQRLHTVGENEKRQAQTYSKHKHAYESVFTVPRLTCEWEEFSNMSWATTSLLKHH